MHRAGLILGLALACAAPVAQATPPDFIQIRDELLAVSADSLLLLRTSTDNLGLHESEIRTTALIELSRTTGAETIWPVYAARRDPDYERDAEPHYRQIQPLDLPGAAAPFDRLHATSALPILPSETDTPPSPIKAEPDGRLTIHGDDGSLLSADLAALQQSALRNMVRYGQRMDYQRFGDVSFAQLFDDQPLYPNACAPAHALQTRDMTGPVPPTIIRLNCGADDGEDLFQASLILLIPPPPP